jgi:hypothetical protein
MAVNLSPVGGVAAQFFTNNGVILSGGKIFTYAAGTTTNQATYTNASGGTAHTNPIILDSAGRVPSGEIWLTDGLQYKFVIKDSNDVLIGTYDNIIGINSNFINFTNQQEIQTATAGQTVFNLTTMTYQPGTNSLSVFVDGVNQYGPGASYAYAETSSTTVTFTVGLHVGAEVKFTTSAINASSYGDAFQINYTPPFTGSVATNVGDKLAQIVSASDFGIVGDGVTNDTTKFTALETSVKGQSVDLSGLVCLVTVIPTGNNYYNGAFQVGTDIFWQNRNPRAHPFEGPATSVRHINPRLGTYCGLNVGLFPKTTGGMVLVWREATTHAVQNGTRLKAAWTDDGGRTIQAYPAPDNDQSLPTISYSATADTRNFASGIINGRFVIVTTRREEPQTSSIYQDPLSIYSDDEGLTWTSVAITGLVDKAINFHSKVYPWPTGGANGAIVFDYRSGGIGALTSTNGGATWNDIGIVVTAGAFPSISEMSVAQIGSQNKWVMVIRTSSTGNFGVSTSTNLTTWTPIVDSGVLLKGNPPELMYADGKLFMVSFSRRNQSILTGYENALLIAEGDADLVYSSSGVDGWSGWKVVSQLGFWPTGYISTAQVRGRWYALMTASEETAGSSTGRTAYLAMLSTDLVDVGDTRSILEAVPQHNLISNGVMEYWPNGISFTSAAARTLIIPDFTFARTSFVSGFTVSQISGDTQKYAMRIQRDNGNTSTANLALTHTLTQLDSYKFIANNEYLSIQFKCRKGTGFSSVNGFLGVQVRYTDTAGEQQVTSAAGTFATTDEPVQSSSTGITPTTQFENYYLQIGPVPSVATQLLIRWVWTPVGTATNDYIDLEQVTLFVGKQRSPVVNRTYAEAVNDSLPFFWTGTVRSENGSRWISFPTIMHRVPTVTVSVGTATNISTLGFELNHSSAADVTVTAQAWL